MGKGLIKFFSDTTRQNRYAKIYRKVKKFTMVPEIEFYDNLCLVEFYGVAKGCVVECGVWKGGMSAAIAKLLGTERAYFLFDSFEGLPPAKDIDGKGAIAWQADKSSPFYFDNCKANESDAITAMKMVGSENFKTIKGYFNETLPDFKSQEKISVLRLDGDWYDSTMECLINLYPHVAEKGLIIIDDYYLWEGCRKAVHDYLSRNSLPDRIRQFNNGNVYYIIKNG